MRILEGMCCRTTKCLRNNSYQSGTLYPLREEEERILDRAHEKTEKFSSHTAPISSDVRTIHSSAKMSRAATDDYITGLEQQPCAIHSLGYPLSRFSKHDFDLLALNTIPKAMNTILKALKVDVSVIWNPLVYPNLPQSRQPPEPHFEFPNLKLTFVILPCKPERCKI
jgi:hypothetical protein